MKKIVLIMSIAAAFCMASCGGGKNVTNVSLKTPQDSLAYAVSLAKSESLDEVVYGQLGVDSACIDDFVRGVCDAFPMSDDAKVKAYVAGLSIGAQAANVYGRANEEVYPGDSVNKLDRAMFLAGLIAGFLAQGYSSEDASIIGVGVHALASRLCAFEMGVHSMLPSDLEFYVARFFAKIGS